ncbi:amidohydrolase [Sphingoaurantiacus capsulatus]|uniref:Amidohydrolase n=1 Tax=Sphingoaurantiacus capsulatus TaxID=1771310 RepID=A0ABV7XAJ4_9SPHN
MRWKLAPLLCLALAGGASAADLVLPAPSDSTYLLNVYRDLHQHPELSFQEVRTAARLAAEARQLGFTVTTGVGKTGVVAVLENGPGPVVMIRADMDALPVQEETGLSFASKATATGPDGQTVPVMHACGHDLHMAAWVGTARRLVADRASWSGTLVMIGQPAEERGGGALAMLNDGLYERFPKPDYVLALHSHAALPAGMIAYSHGYALANVDSVDLDIRGIGGHGAYPQVAKDPIMLASRTVVALQELAAKESQQHDTPAVISVGSIHGGSKHNIIPDEVRLQLTVRSYGDESRARLLDGIRRIALGEAQAAGFPQDRMPVMTVGDDFTPATYNTDRLTRHIGDLFAERFGKDKVILQPAVMGGEDFSEYYRADTSIESLIFWLGAVDPVEWRAVKGNPSKLPAQHSSRFAPDAAPTIAMGVEAMSSAALGLFGRDAKPLPPATLVMKGSRKRGALSAGK